ncbi:MAG: DNA/RNA nuclease SfsA [Dehalococcoidia bacterium]
MKLSSNLIKASFVERVNRFAAVVRLERSEVLAHVPNSGRLKELFTPGRTVYLAPRNAPHRKAQYDQCLVAVDQVLVSCDARLPNPVVAEAIRSGCLSHFRGYHTVEREVTFGESRLDMRLSGQDGCCFVETKSITLVVNDTGLFPDAPTSRGIKHLRSLARAVEEGHRAAAIFVVQREDAARFAPNDDADSHFASVLREVAGRGVEVYAYRCRVSLTEVVLLQELPVLL